MRILFAGTPDIAVTSLRALLDSEHEVIGVVTRPPAPQGRTRNLVPSPVHRAAAESGIPVLTPSRISEATDEIAALTPDAAAVVAYGGLIRPPLLHAFPWVNLHFSLLPRWRGAAPVQRAIEAGDSVTGVSVFRLEEGLDTGPVYASARVELEGNETTGSLLVTLANVGSPLVVDTLSSIGRGEDKPVPQEGDVTLAPRLMPEDGRIDWFSSILHISRLTRAFWPSPGTWTTLGGVRAKIGPVQVGAPYDGDEVAPGTVVYHGKQVVVATDDGWVVLDRIAPPGRPWMDAAAWMRGLREQAVFE